MIKENDCVKIEYNAYTKEDNKLFDTTSEAKAKSEGLHQEGGVYEPISAIIGKGFMVKGVEESLIGKKEGDKYTIIVPAEKGFGKWSAKNTENIKMSSFKKQNINPVKGMIINIGGVLCRVALVIPGRFVKVDYNHPLAGKELVYEVKVVEKSEKDADKLKTIIKALIGRDAEVIIKERKAKVKTKEEVPGNLKELVKKTVKETLKKGYDLTFIR